MPFLIFHQRRSDAIILYDNMQASAIYKVVTFAGEVFFERKTPNVTKPEAIAGDRCDLRKSGHLEESYLLNEK